VPHLYLFGEQSQLQELPDWITHVEDWKQTTNAVLRRLEEVR
jgi:hypothetical protein